MRFRELIGMKLIRIYLIVFLLLVIVVFFIQLAVIASMSSGSSSIGPPDGDKELLKLLSNDITMLDRKLEKKVPKSPYLIINSSENRFSLMKGRNLIKEDKCSTGSYVLLKNGDQQQWMFKTPKGEFQIRSKTEKPVWKKPDWAFVEEGIPVPSANHSSRFEYGVLGDYSLGIGDGYLIHGTLYQRFIGLPVTHGCVRLNDENLKLVYHSLSLGSKVYVF